MARRGPTTVLLLAVAAALLLWSAGAAGRLEHDAPDASGLPLTNAGKLLESHTEAASRSKVELGWGEVGSGEGRLDLNSQNTPLSPLTPTSFAEINVSRYLRRV
jgi:hypothetical protein